MKLIDDWSVVFRRAWSVRFALIAAVFYAVDVGIQLVAAAKPSPLFAGLAALSALLSAVSRIVDQSKSLRHGRHPDRTDE